MQSELVANEELPRSRRRPAGRPAALPRPAGRRGAPAATRGATLVHHRPAQPAARGRGDGPRRRRAPGTGRTPRPTRTGPAPPWPACCAGPALRVVKFIGYGWSSQRSRPALRDQVHAALAAARSPGWDGLLAEQREYLDAFWDAADVEVDGDPEVQQAVRFAVFHVLQAGARAEQRSDRGQGPDRPGLRRAQSSGTPRCSCLPVLTYTLPDAAARRCAGATPPATWPATRAEQLGSRGAAFPWRTIRGQECSGYWPAGTAAFHINADIADAVRRYLHATGDDEFDRAIGLELLVETARLWRSLGHHDRHGVFHLDGVTGPDEYTALVDDNVYTNLMAAPNLRAPRTPAPLPRRGRRLGVDDEEAALARRGRRHARAVRRRTCGCTSRPRTSPATRSGTSPARRRQVPAAAARAVLRPLPQAGGQAGRPGAGHALAGRRVHRRAEGPQLRLLRGADRARLLAVGLHQAVWRPRSATSSWPTTTSARPPWSTCTTDGNTGDGVHIASLAGAWIAGLVWARRPALDDDRLRFAPRLPPGIDRLAFGMLWQGRQLRVQVTADEAEYRLVSGRRCGWNHHGEPLALADAPVRRPILEAQWVDPVEQPYERSRGSAIRAVDAGRDPGTSRP